MMSGIVLRSPAKINLHLEIGSRRGDGFHDLCSLFQIVSLMDTIRIRSLKDTNTCRIIGDFSCPPEKNLIFKAYRLFCEETGICPGIEVSVEKCIPEGAGLGGGSSNAATMLKGLNELFSRGLTTEDLARLGSRLGSDVPFFCRAPLAVVAGRGEKVFPLAEPRTLPLVLILPDFSISTVEAYGWLDDSVADRKKGTDEDKSIPDFHLSEEKIPDFYRQPPEEWKFFNSFTPVLISRYTRIDKYLGICKEAGALHADVSGSGSAIFAVFANKAQASVCKENLIGAKDLKQVLIIETLARFPTSILQ